MKANLYVEYENRQTYEKDLIEAAKEIWKQSGKRIKDIQQLDLYYKPQENRCYYVVNSQEEGSFSI